MKTGMWIVTYGFFWCLLTPTFMHGNTEWVVSPKQISALSTDMLIGHPYATVALLVGSIMVLNYLFEDVDENQVYDEERSGGFLLLKIAIAGALLDMVIHREHSIPGKMLWLIHHYNEKGALQFLPWLTWHGIKKVIGY